MHQGSAGLLEHDRNRPTIGLSEHLGDPSINRLGRMLQLLVRTVSMAIDDVAIMLLIGPIRFR